MVSDNHRLRSSLTTGTLSISSSPSSFLSRVLAEQTRPYPRVTGWARAPEKTTDRLAASLAPTALGPPVRSLQANCLPHPSPQDLFLLHPERSSTSRTEVQGAHSCAPHERVLQPSAAVRVAQASCTSTAPSHPSPQPPASASRQRPVSALRSPAVRLGQLPALEPRAPRRRATQASEPAGSAATADPQRCRLPPALPPVPPR